MAHGPLIPPKAPNLLIAPPAEYEPKYQEQLNNANRLYYNTIDNMGQSLLGADGGRFISCPTMLAYDTTDQSPTVINTAYAVTYNSVYITNSLSLQDSSKFTATYPGVYNFQFSAQITSTNASTKVVSFWIRKNGVDIGYSRMNYTLSGSGEQLNAMWNFNIDLQETGYIQIMWAADNTGVLLESIAASPPYPASASSVMAVSYVSNLEGLTIATAP